jgi:hypothetical protein
MRLSELLHATVLDADGVDIGAVDDVRLVQDGPLLLPFGAALRIEGLVLGHAAIGIRLGFGRKTVTGPWLLRVIFNRLARRARYAPWRMVESIEDGVVRLRVPRSQLEPVPEALTPGSA